MSTLKIKLCDLNEGDIGSIKSMFHLTSTQRKDDWEIVSSGSADLYIYSFESEKSIAAWQKHSSADGLSVLFSTNLDVDVAVDIVLKKPLRTKNFTEVLNTAAQKINQSLKANNKSPEEIALDEIYATETSQDDTVSVEKSSLFSSMSKRIMGKHSPHRDLSKINFELPEQTEIQADLIIEPVELTESLNQHLANHDENSLINAILRNLIPLNRFVIPLKTRQTLLEIYHQSTFQLMRGWETRVKQLIALPHDEYLKSVQDLTLLIDELATAYKIMFMEHYQQGHHPKSNRSFLLIISRLAQYCSLGILHANCFLRSEHLESISSLHQLYLCCEAAEVLDLEISSKEDAAPIAFSSIYIQTILSSIADPFRLTQTEVLKLYRLMAKYTKKVTITSFSEKQLDNNSLMGGLFYLNLAGNNLPVSLDRVSEQERNLPNARLINTHSALVAIEKIFQTAAATNEDSVYSPEIQLLKKVTPHLNNSYERQYDRFDSEQNFQVRLVDGLENIHQALKSDNQNSGSLWNINNQSLGGMMVCHPTITCSHIEVGDFYCVFDENNVPSLATIRWLRHNNEQLEMGIELLFGEPIAIHSSVVNGPEELTLLLLRNKKRADTLLAPKGRLNPDETLELTESDKTYIISIDSLIDNSSSYDHFSFTVI